MDRSPDVSNMRLADPPEPGAQFSFDPKMCCDHDWRAILDEKGKRTPNEYCHDCGATCVREHGGYSRKIIVEFDAVAGFFPGRAKPTPTPVKQTRKEHQHHGRRDRQNQRPPRKERA